MTRINCIPPSKLCDLHLLAEYREIYRVRNLYPNYIGLHNKESNVRHVASKKYILGKGHVLFFADKGLWLQQRSKDLIGELAFRGVEINLQPLSLGHWPTGAMNNWTPTAEDMRTNLDRIIANCVVKNSPIRFTCREDEPFSHIFKLCIASTIHLRMLEKDSTP